MALLRRSRTYDPPASHDAGNCHCGPEAFCEEMQNTPDQPAGVCLAHGVDVPYFKPLFQTVENIIAYIEKDEPTFFLRFLEDVFPYMEKYQYRLGMERVLFALETAVPNYGSNEDRALLLDYRATMEKNDQKAIKYEKDALALIPEINASNALLVSNLHSNLGGLYANIKQYALASEHMETGLRILEEYQPIPRHDMIAK